MRRRDAGGFTLIETMIALAVLALGITGAVSGLIFTRQELRTSQLHKYAAVLADSKTQRLLLADKTTWAVAPVTADPPAPVTFSTDPRKAAIGATPWVPDPSPMSSTDQGTGAYFQVLSDGTITSITTIASGTKCDDSSLPRGIYCREVFLQKGLVTGASTMLPGTAIPLTYWIRVSRVGDPVSLAVTHAEVVVP